MEISLGRSDRIAATAAREALSYRIICRMEVIGTNHSERVLTIGPLIHRCLAGAGAVAGASSQRRASLPLVDPRWPAFHLRKK